MEGTTLSDDELHEQVRKLLLGNISQGYSKALKAEYCFIRPSPESYPFQFWWDTCFHVFILCALGEYDWAKKNMLSLFAPQEADGFVGHMISWEKVLPKNAQDILQARPTLHQHVKPNMSALIEPPLVAQAVLRIYEDTHDLAFVSTMLPKLKKYFAWLVANRDFEGNGLLSIITPFESGMDWKPSFDPVVGFRHRQANAELFWRVMWVDLRNFLRRYNVQAIYKADYFIVKEVGFNTLYVQDLHALARLCSLVQDNDANKFETRAKQVARSMLELMYDAEAAAFFDIYFQSPQTGPEPTWSAAAPLKHKDTSENRKGQVGMHYGHTLTKSKILTPTIFFPMVLPDIPESIGRAIVERHLFKKEEFQTPYLLPSVAVNDPAFDPFEAPIYLWRGPTWVVSNWFLYQCLLCNGYVEEANKLLETVKKLIAKSGFREYYHPFVGDGYGAKDFTWSGLVVDMMCMKKANQGQVQGRKAQ